MIASNRWNCKHIYVQRKILVVTRGGWV